MILSAEMPFNFKTKTKKMAALEPNSARVQGRLRVNQALLQLRQHADRRTAQGSITSLGEQTKEQDKEQGSGETPGGADALFVGACFSSYAEVSHAVDAYTARHCMKLYRAESRTLIGAQRHARRRGLELAPPLLLYFSVVYACTHGGKKFRSTSTGARPGRRGTQKQGCPFTIHLCLTQDLQCLQVTKMSAVTDHNHPLSPVRQQRRSLDTSAPPDLLALNDTSLPYSSSARIDLCAPHDPCTVQCHGLVQSVRKSPPDPARASPSHAGVVAAKGRPLGARFKISCLKATTCAKVPLAKAYKIPSTAGSVLHSDGGPLPRVEAAAMPGIEVSSALSLGADQRSRGDVGASSSHEGLLASTLHLFQRRALFCDTVLLTRDSGVVHVHSAVLAALCPRLLPALNHNPLARHQPNVVDLTRYDLALVTRLTDFFYTGMLGPAPGGEEAEIREVFELLGVIFDPLVPHADASDGAISVADWIDSSVLATEDMCCDALKEVTREQVTTESSLQLPTDLPFELKRELYLDTSGGNTHLPDELVTPLLTDDCIVDIYAPQDVIDSLNPQSLGQVDGVPAGTEGLVKGWGLPGEGREPSLIKLQPAAGPSLRTELLPKGGMKPKLGRPKKGESRLRAPVGSVRCEFCMRVFASQHQVDRHKWSHYRCAVSGAYRCKLCDKPYTSRTALRQHVRAHSQTKKCVCAVCGHCFINKRRLASHVNSHTGARPHQCEECGSCFNDAEYLAKHRRLHRGDKRFACDVCDKRFLTGTVLRDHMRTHTGEKPFQCAVCGACFTARTSFKFHMRTHTGERPFACEQCPRRFPRAARLKLHVLNMHTDRSARPHHCTLCTRTYSTSTEFNNHLLTHSAGLTTRGKRSKRSLKAALDTETDSKLNIELMNERCRGGEVVWLRKVDQSAVIETVVDNDVCTLNIDED